MTETLELVACEIAQQLSGHLQDACGDLAYEQCRCNFDEASAKKIREAKKNGVKDIPGWLADEYYNNPAFVKTSWVISSTRKLVVTLPYAQPCWTNWRRVPIRLLLRLSQTYERTRYGRKERNLGLSGLSDRVGVPRLG